MKCLVVSYDPDQAQTFHDLVEAPTEQDARTIVELARNDASSIAAYNVVERRWMADNLEELTCASSVDELRARMDTCE